MPGVRQGSQHPYSKSVQAEIIDVDRPAVVGNMSAQSLNLLKLNRTVAVESNSKPATQCLKLYDVRSKPHFCHWQRNISWTNVKISLLILDIPRCPISYRNQPETSPSINPSPEASPSSIARCLATNDYDKQRSLTCTQWITPWVNSTVVTRKPNSTIRLFRNPHDLNKAMQRIPYHVRTIDDVIPKASGASHFSTLEARSGFWQVKLDDKNSKLCTVSTLWTKYRWKRLPFGLTCNGDVFQEWMNTVFGKLDGLSGIADDPFIYCKSEQEHDQHILNVLDTARDNNLQFNPDKFQFKVGQDGDHCWWRHRPPPARTLRLKSRRTESHVPAKKQDMDSTKDEGRGEWAAVQQCEDSWWV